MKRIIVCMKQVIDPEAPVSSFQVDSEERRVVPPKGVPSVLNPFDENALEAALRIKDNQGTEIMVISMGRRLAKSVLRKSLAVGADRLILLEDDAFEDLDSYSTATLLAQAIKRIGEYTLILCGREAADTNAGLVGSGIAEILGIPSINIAGKVEIKEQKIEAHRILDDGYEVIEATIPALVTASNEIGELRYPAIKSLMEAQKKEVTVWNSDDLQVEPSEIKRTKLLELYQPTRRQVKCELIENENLEESGTNLAMKLRELGVI